MRITNFNIFEGRNIYSHKKCIRMDVDLEGYCETPSKMITGFNLNLVDLVPELRTHRCGIDEEGGFVKRLKEGTYLSHICEHIIIALQNRLGLEVKYGKAREVKGDHYYIIYQYEYVNTALEIGNIAVELINALIDQKQFMLDEKIMEAKKVLSKEALGPSTLAICEEAKKRGIPIIKIGDGSVFQLGYGKYSKRIEATIAENTGTIGVDASCDKYLTKELLDIQCLPVAKGAKISNSIDLLLEVRNIGYPLVLKPRYGNQGKGVYANIRNEKDLLEAYKALTEEYKDIIIEECIYGYDYRVCVVNGEVVAVSKRLPPFIVGDGERSIKELISELNNDPLRGEGHEKPLTKVKIDDKLLRHIARDGYTLDTVICSGKEITLRDNANLSTGGVAIDCTEEICDENIDICKRAASAIGLNICGIDIICEDISRPINGQGVILEVNAAPGIRMHHYPYKGVSRNVAGKIVDMMFEHQKERVPVISITGTNGKTTTTRLISHILQLSGHNVGMTTTGGIYLNNKCIKSGDTTGPISARTVLLNKDVDAAVLETARGGIIRSGLAYDLADVGVITNITEDHLGIDNINTLEELAYVKSLVGEAVKDEGYVVINADDKMSLTILDRIKSNIIFFSKYKDNKVLSEHIYKGGYGIYIEQDYLYVEGKEGKFSIIDVKDIGITLQGKLEYNLENAMAACAALIGLGVDCNIIRDGLVTFYCNEELNPGRFNLYNIGDTTVILDYGHNTEGYRAVLDGAKKISNNRLIGVIGVPGDRLNESIVEVGSISAQYFDHIFIKEDIDKRNRSEGEVAELLLKGIKSTGFDYRSIDIILNEVEALNYALESSQPGDVIVVFFEKYEPLIKLVKEKIEAVQKDNIKEDTESLCLA